MVILTLRRKRFLGHQISAPCQCAANLIYNALSQSTLYDESESGFLPRRPLAPVVVRVRLRPGRPRPLLVLLRHGPPRRRRDERRKHLPRDPDGADARAD